ncbi:MAG: hypothetical protein HDS71_01895 [Bacteroidales bacterium]|nr:hypothetical protein [Bacteroidales bacterium]
MMKKLVLLFTVILLSCVSLSAQKRSADKEKDHAEMRKEITDFKIKFLAQEMELTDEQQKKFAPIYRQMSEEKGPIYHEIFSMKRKLNNKSSEAEYESFGKAVENTKDKMAAIDKKYNAQLSKFLSAKQIYKMKTAEETFHHKMREMRDKKKNKKH